MRTFKTTEEVYQHWGGVRSGAGQPDADDKLLIETNAVNNNAPHEPPAPERKP